MISITQSMRSVFKMKFKPQFQNVLKLPTVVYKQSSLNICDLYMLYHQTYGVVVVVIV